MYLLAPACEAIAATTKKLEKIRIVADYLRSRTLGEAAVSAIFLSGRPFPQSEESTLQVGGAALWRAIQELSGKRESTLVASYRKRGDLGGVAHDMLPEIENRADQLNVLDVMAAFREIAATRGAGAKYWLVKQLLAKATPLEAKYLVKIMTGDLRIGLKESLVEEAIARAYGAPVAEVAAAKMLLGDIGETLRLAADRRLNEARIRMFHPLGFMLASPVENAAEAFEYFEHGVVEDKYDGIRAQAHASAGRVRLFSRTLDEITEFPELTEPLAAFSEDVILDGEIVAWDYGDESGGRALPFSELQKRLGRKKVSEEMMRQVPVAYVVFDVLYAGGELVIHEPLRNRAVLLDRIFASSRQPILTRAADPQGKLLFEPEVESENGSPIRVIRAPAVPADSPQQLETLFEAAQARGNEGLMIKDVQSKYGVGRRGRSWLKLKRELATLDVVVTAVEYGHGKRISVLSDYTFAVRDGERLLNIGKAYSGLTDAEISELTQWFLTHTLDDRGFTREVEPKIIIEVAFNAVMKSDRHNSGFALRFPRILRIRSDKSPADVDTIERVREIFERQKKTTTS
jgi:ATP-dependent DNA ligase I